MRRRVALLCLGALLVASGARSDIPPEPDRGPSSAVAGGLNFAVQSVEVRMRPDSPAHSFYRTLQVIVLVGCVDGHSNCRQARAKNLIGMEVSAVDGHDLQPRYGRIQQIVDAFENAGTTKPVTLDLFSRAAASGMSIVVSFERGNGGEAHPGR